jgi:hypothetical protein
VDELYDLRIRMYLQQTFGLVACLGNLDVEKNSRTLATPFYQAAALDRRPHLGKTTLAECAVVGLR